MGKAYDNLGRLKQEQDGTDTISYTYDKFGNRETMTNNGNVTSYTYDLNNRLLQEVSGDEFTFYNYDNKGNLYSKRTEERSAAGGLTRVDTFGALKDNINSTVEIYSYNGLNRMSEVRKGGITAQYTYNAEGIRTSKTVNGITTDFLLDGANVVAETKNNTTTSYIRGVSGIISSEIVGNNNSRKYYLSDGHGNITNLTDSTGVVVKTYTYDAFGVEQNIDSNDTNPFRYCGEYYDSEINQIYLRARYYNPTLGRFTQQDPAMEDGYNWYVYCGNEPINRFDRTGLAFSWDEFKWAIDEYGISITYEIYQISNDARDRGLKYAKETNLPQSWDNKADALRHFLWNVNMTRSTTIGYNRAKTIANRHELDYLKSIGWVDNSPRFQPANSVKIYTKMNQSTLMDLWNNQVGRELGNNSQFRNRSDNELWVYAVNNNLLILDANQVYEFLGVQSFVNSEDWTVNVAWDLKTGNITFEKSGETVTLKIGV